MNNQMYNLENEEQIILQLQNEIKKNNELIEKEKIKLKKTTKVLKVIYIIIGLWMLCCVGSCAINSISNNTPDSGCMG